MSGLTSISETPSAADVCFAALQPLSASPSPGGKENAMAVGLVGTPEPEEPDRTVVELVQPSLIACTSP